MMSIKFTEKDMTEWISKVTGKKCKNMSYLKDGTLLCELVNKLEGEGTIEGINYGNNVGRHRENIIKFVKHINEDVGVELTFSPDQLWSVAKRKRTAVPAIIDYNNVLKNSGKFKGPWIEKVKKQKAGWTGGLLEQKDQEIKNKIHDPICW